MYVHRFAHKSDKYSLLSTQSDIGVLNALSYDEASGVCHMGHLPVDIVVALASKEEVPPSPNGTVHTVDLEWKG